MRELHTFFFFFFNDTATTEIYTLSLHDALPICLTIWRATVVGSGHLNPPGMLGHHEGRVVISAADGAVLPIEVQPENKRRMPWAEYLRGARLAAGARFLRPAFLEP